MGTLDKKTIETLMTLCRIDCSLEEQESLQHDLAQILAYIEQLQEVDTTHASHRNQILEGVTNVMRDDVVKDLLPREQFLMNAPAQIGGMIRVPPVIKKE